MPDIRDIFIAIDELVLPAGAKLPCVGIKDGQVTTRKLACAVIEKTMQVTVICWAPQGKESAQVTGDATQPGAVSMTASVESVLDSNLLAIPGMIDADVMTETASRMFINAGKKSIQQKTITFEYVRQR